MKIILTGAGTIISYVGMFASSIWAIVSFIIYLVKDKPFDWYSLLMLGGFFIMFIVGVFSTAYFSAYERKSNMNNMKSRFQERLEQMQKDRERK